MNVRARLSPLRPDSPVLWYAVLGAPAAWAAQFGIGYWISEAKCSTAGSHWGIGVQAWAIIVGAVAIAAAAGAGLTALSLFLRTRDADAKGPPPEGRIHFLAIVGLTVCPLFLAIMAMTTVGVLVLYPCNQS